jgi:hypothetical protein
MGIMQLIRDYWVAVSVVLIILAIFWNWFEDRWRRRYVIYYNHLPPVDRTARHEQHDDVLKRLREAAAIVIDWGDELHMLIREIETDEVVPEQMDNHARETRRAHKEFENAAKLLDLMIQAAQRVGGYTGVPHTATEITSCTQLGC